MNYEVLVNGQRRVVSFDPSSIRTPRISSTIRATVDGRAVEADIAQLSPGTYSVLLGGKSLELTIEDTANGLLVRSDMRESLIQISDPRAWRSKRAGGAELEGRQQVSAPMSGKIVRVLATQGQRVEKGQGLLVMEAMKMQNEIRSPKAGVLERLNGSEGQAVTAGEVLAVIT